MTAMINEHTQNGVDTATLFAGGGQISVPRQQRVAQRDAQPQHDRRLLRRRREPSHERTFHFDGDHPAVLVGNDSGHTPVEYVLHALAACLTAGLANIAAARGVRLTEVRSTVVGDIDLNGILGLNPDVRNGYEKISVASRSRATPRRRC